MIHPESQTIFALPPRPATCSDPPPYTPSVASTLSSAISVFSAADGPSSLSSASSSVRSAALSWDGDAPALPRPPTACARSRAALAACPAKARTCQTFGPAGPVVPPELRLHPRRTQCAVPAEAAPALPRQPPALVRQCDRKDNFVETLVDTTSQMIEVIWPLSLAPCGRDTVLGGKNLIGLRTFIQEVLKRSKTSYSTLQVALYYLVLIKPCIPAVDFTREQPHDSHAARAMQCGRRMFLAALILASKYLQDRNYSARAWSKISGLKITEINSNEIAFVTAVDWKLHIPEPLFQRWTDVVLKYSLSVPAGGAPRGAAPSWRAIVARLTPALDTVALDEPARPASPPRAAPSARAASPASPMSPPALPATPEVLEPPPRAPAENYRFPPISPKITQLPTPQMTPHRPALGAPAASARGPGAGRSAMSCAMQHAQQLSMHRCAVDAWADADTHPYAFARRGAPLPVRRSSEERSISSIMSSPESMVSDASSQTSQSSQASVVSRCSSVSSVASASGALAPSVRLTAQATRRCAAIKAEMWSHAHPFVGVAEESYIRGHEDPEATAAIALRDLALATADLPCGPARCRKRERPASGPDPRLQAEVGALLLQQQPNGCRGPHVATDPFAAESFLLARGDLPASDCAPCVSGSDAPARKRVCYPEQVSQEERLMTLAHNPGMWNHIL